MYRNSHNFTQYQIFLDSKCYSSNLFSRMIIIYFIGLENILINEILFIFQTSNNIYVKNVLTKDKYAWNSEELRNFYWEDDFFTCIFNRLFAIIKIICGFFLAFNITSIYIRTAIICSPICFLLLSNFIHFL